MKFDCITGLGCLLLLNACVAYPAHTNSNVDTEVKVADSTGAAIGEEAEYKDDDRIICKLTIITGSRFKQKVCMTWFEWRDIGHRGKDYVHEVQSASTRVDIQ